MTVPLLTNVRLGPKLLKPLCTSYKNLTSEDIVFVPAAKLGVPDEIGDKSGKTSLYFTVIINLGSIINSHWETGSPVRKTNGQTNLVRY